MNKMDETTESIGIDSQITNNNQVSYYQPVRHFVLLSILTFGLYDIYWYYRNWMNLKTFKDLDINPVWRTIGLFIPILGFILIYHAHKDYKNLFREEGMNRTIYPGLIVVVIIIAGSLLYLPDPYWLICFLSTIPLAMVQSVLNDYWIKVQPNFIQRANFRGRQIVLIVVGVIWWILIIYGMFLPE